MTKDSKYADNKELMIIPDAVHTDLYDGGDKDYIPFDKIESFMSSFRRKVSLSNAGTLLEEEDIHQNFSVMRL
ncbi:hypothetical protein SAMN02910369_01883 [Lachnospiraceae bacterium NE2001]|nr:hypothetical protein SAMN02910369_01883 [Lachnospiraceae bacterium NE2001]